MIVQCKVLHVIRVVCASLYVIFSAFQYVSGVPMSILSSLLFNFTAVTLSPQSMSFCLGHVRLTFRFAGKT